MIENNLFAFRRKKKKSVPFLTKSSNVQNCSYRRKYDLVYMIEKYGGSSKNYIQWFNENVNPNGNKNAIEFVDVSGLSIMKHKDTFVKFRNVYVLDQHFGNMVHFKTSIKNVVSDFKVRLSTESKLNFPNDSIDIIYTNSLFNLIPECVKLNFLSEGLRILKNDGVFYFANLSSEYYDCIYQLLNSYNSHLAEGLDMSKCVSFDVDEIQHFLEPIFLDVQVENFNCDWWITNVDDFIGYLLSEREFEGVRPLISEGGLSKFRIFLLNKIKQDGGILVKRRINLIVCKNKCSLELVV